MFSYLDGFHSSARDGKGDEDTSWLWTAKGHQRPAYEQYGLKGLPPIFSHNAK